MSEDNKEFPHPGYEKDHVVKDSVERGYGRGEFPDYVKRLRKAERQLDVVAQVAEAKAKSLGIRNGDLEHSEKHSSWSVNTSPLSHVKIPVGNKGRFSYMSGGNAETSSTSLEIGSVTDEEVYIYHSISPDGEHLTLKRRGPGFLDMINWVKLGEDGTWSPFVDLENSEVGEDGSRTRRKFFGADDVDQMPQSVKDYIKDKFGLESLEGFPKNTSIEELQSSLVSQAYEPQTDGPIFPQITNPDTD